MAVRGRQGALLIAGCGLLLGTSAQAAPCETATAEADVQAGIDAGLAAFSAMDPAAMAAAEAQTLEAVSCLGTVLAPAAAARVHGLVGMAAFVAQDGDRELSALAAALAVDPGFAWPEETVPAGHALRKDLAAAGATPAPGQPLELDKGLTAWSDGIEATVVPPDRPTLLQVGASTEDLSASAWRMPGDPLPPGVALGEAPDMLQAEDTGAVRRRLAWTALGTGVAAGLSYGASALVLRSYEADPRTTQELENRKTAVRGLSIGAGALGAAAVGLGVGAAVTGTW